MTPTPYEEWLQKFVQGYNRGRRLSILATGGGTPLASLAGVPGASRIFHSFYSPYDTQESVEFINRHYPLARNKGKAYAEKSVCKESAEELYMALWTKNKMYGHLHIDNIAITAACTTTRYRRGDNHAFIAFQDENLDHVVWHLKLNKLFDEESHNKLSPKQLYGVRLGEDRLIATTALRLACDYEPETLEGMKTNGTLVCV